MQLLESFILAFASYCQNRFYLHIHASVVQLQSTICQIGQKKNPKWNKTLVGTEEIARIQTRCCHELGEHTRLLQIHMKYIL